MPVAPIIGINVTWAQNTGTNGFTFEPHPPTALLPGNETGTNNFAIVFTLGGPDGAVWDTGRTGGAILWTVQSPPPLQSGFTLPSLNANQFAVGVNNDNTTTEPIHLGFHLFVVALESSHESADPEIVLDPP